MHVMPHGRHCRSQNPRPNVIRNAVQSGCNTRTLRDGSIITGHGIDRSDYCLIAYVKTGTPATLAIGPTGEIDKG